MVRRFNILERQSVGWWTSTGEGDSTRTAENVAREKAYALRYLGADGTEMHWTLIRAAMASVANTVLVPMQDLLGLGSDARMNMPGRPGGNWRFRFSWDQLTPDVIQRLRLLVTTYGRARAPEAADPGTPSGSVPPGPVVA